VKNQVVTGTMGGTELMMNTAELILKNKVIEALNLTGATEPHSRSRRGDTRGKCQLEHSMPIL
jgi:hypothetical protein